LLHGHVVPQLHAHLIARSESDPAGPHPVLVRLKPRAYDRVTAERFAALLRDTLDLTFRLHIE
jgi:diadenosine tetraphosphate (Ap4A) HIT family hydrolase